MWFLLRTGIPCSHLKEGGVYKYQQVCDTDIYFIFISKCVLFHFIHICAYACKSIKSLIHTENKNLDPHTKLITVTPYDLTILLIIQNVL